jgi:hypothetical protein
MNIFFKNFRFSWMLIIVPVSVLITSVLVSEAQNIFGIRSILISIGFLSFTFLGTMYVYYRLSKEHIDKFVMPKFENELQMLPAESESGSVCLCDNTIISDIKLAAYEKSCDCQEIWVVSNDLSTELDGGLYADVVPANLQRGVSYKIFVAKSNIVLMRIEQLKRKHNNQDKIKYYILDDDFFFLVARFDFTIYDPYKTAATGRIGYIGFNLSQNDELTAIKVTDSLVDAIASKLLEYIDNDKLEQE